MSRRVVAVLAGGVSPERDISLASARSVLEGLPPDRYEGLPVEIRMDGRFSVGGDAPVRPERAAAVLVERGVEVVFPGLHGRYGEDGTIQGFLAVLGLPCVGSGVAASALAMDKVRTREVLAAVGMPMPDAEEIRWDDPATERAARVARLGLPAVVKDPTGGSSLDLHLARTAADRDEAIGTLLARAAGRVLVEAFVPGREVTCPVLGSSRRGEEIRALPPILIRPIRSTWFDYETKYDPAAVEELCPAPVEASILARVAELARAAHRRIGCDGLTRTDFIVPEDGEPRFLEINTLPGLTPASLCPKSAAAAGIPFGELLATLVEMALALRGTD